MRTRVKQILAATSLLVVGIGAGIYLARDSIKANDSTVISGPDRLPARESTRGEAPTKLLPTYPIIQSAPSGDTAGV